MQELIATPTPDGYIGTYDATHQLGTWDIWGRKYVLLGLLAYYDLTGDKKVLDAARGEADFLMQQAPPGKVNLSSLGLPILQGVAPSSVLEPMALLYRRTGEKKYLDFAQNIVPGSVDRGKNFQEQWRRAFELDPPFVMVTGWNEWVAGRWIRPGEPILFVDQYNEEFSRDIEPMKGGHEDNYYYQLVANVRRYKGVPAVPQASLPKTIIVTKDFAQWQDVEPEFSGHAGETAPRDFAGVGGTHYQNFSGRNDLAVCKVARDMTNIYFYVRTVAPLTPGTDTNWMWLLIDSDQNPQTGWAGYDFIVNRTRAADGKFWLEKNSGGWNWEKVVPVELQVQGSELQLAIPRAALGLKAGETKTAIDFKWADNLQHPGDVMDFYISGAVAPVGRFNYRFIGD